MNNWNNVKCICTEQKLINYTPYLYLHYLYYLFFTLSIAIYSLYYLYFLLCLLIFIYLFLSYRSFSLPNVLVYLLINVKCCPYSFHNLTFPCPKFQDDNIWDMRSKYTHLIIMIIIIKVLLILNNCPARPDSRLPVIQLFKWYVLMRYLRTNRA